MNLTKLFSILNTVLPNKIFYGSNIYDNDDNASMPFIVYQEITKRPRGYVDNHPSWYRSTIQITLVTKSKDINLERSLEKTMLDNDLIYSVISENRNSDRSVNRVYEINMEEI
ncbi:MAG: hypothetical protein WCX96_03600 [Bacilli bacterium]